MTLSIGLISGNSPLLSSYSQNNALSQSGISGSEQEANQGQSSDQKSQVVSGDSSILFGNYLCQDYENNDLTVLKEVSGDGGVVNVPTYKGPAVLKVTTIVRGNCSGSNCPPADGPLRIISYGGLVQLGEYPHTRTTAGGVSHYGIPSR